MKVSVVPIGNSKGIRIPKAILLQCHIKECVNLEVEDEHIVLMPYQENPREGWENDFERMHKNKDDQLIMNDNIDLEMENWVWQ